MGCLSAILTRLGGSHIAIERVSYEVTAFFKRIPGVSVRCERIGGSSAEYRRIGGMKCRMGLVCGTNLGDFEVLWVQDGPLLTVDNGYLITRK